MAPFGLRAAAAAAALALHLAAALPAAAQDRATLRGVVRDSASGAPVASAQVSLPALGRSVAADSAGRFSLDRLNPGTYGVEIRRLGYSPLQTTVRVAAGEGEEHAFELSPEPAALAEVTVTGTSVPPRLRSFEAHRQLGHGRFLTSAELDRQAERRLADVIRSLAPSVRHVRGDGNEVYLASSRMVASGALRGSPRPCYLQVFLDGMRLYGQGQGGRGAAPFDINSLLTRNIEAVEFYGAPATTPPEYRNDTAQCGTLVLWSRGAPR